MALLGLGGRGLRERLIQQYGILPPGSVGQTLFDEVIPTVLVDDLTQGLVLDSLYRPPAAGHTTQAGVVAELAFSSIQARAGALVLVERIEFQTEGAAPVIIRVGATGSPIGSPIKAWRDRRMEGEPTALVTQGTRSGSLGTQFAERTSIATEFRSMDLNVILRPGSVGESTISIWCNITDTDLQVNWFWKEMLEV